MLRRSRGFLVLALSVLSIPALAAEEETTEAPASEATQSAPASPAPAATTDTTAPSDATVATPPAVELKAEEKHEGLLEGWRTEVHGYFRAPMTLGISSRPNPDAEGSGASHLQISYGPNRVMDWSYYSFAYTRLQEQDWAEMTFAIKKKHVTAEVGWMGYWLSATGYRNNDAAGVPGIAALALDTDFQLGTITPNIMLKMGAFWPGYGYFEKYDTFTLGRFRHIGEQLRLTIPVNTDLTVTIDQGFGTGRDGAYNPVVAANTPLYANRTGANLLAYGNVQLSYQKYAKIGLHYNYTWTRDPYLTAEASPTAGKAYTQVADAHMAVAGLEANLSAPVAGRLWISPSYLDIKNGWALSMLGSGGVEIMHSQGGAGIATNYLGLSNAVSASTGSGSMLNLGFLYENSLSNVLGQVPGSLPDVKVSGFGLLAKVSRDLPSGSPVGDKLTQFKYGADATLQALTWLGVMLRYDTVNYDLDNPGYIFSAITSRLTIASHYLSGERIYLQFSRYRYGDKMVLAGDWPWGAVPLVAGTHEIQGGHYGGKKPDENVVKLQAEIVF